MTGSVLEIRNLSHGFSGRRVLDGVNIEVGEAEVAGLLGPNGAGKTTAFLCATGLIKPHSGSVILNDRVIDEMPLHKRARLGMGYLPQGESVFSGLSVRDNVFAVLEANGKRDALKTAGEILERFGLSHLAGQKAATLSGGEKRRLEVARAVSLEPKVLLTDEPFTGVDPIASEELGRILKDLARNATSVFLTDHNVHETLKICDRAYLLFDGKIMAAGTPEELAGNEMVRRHYLGEGFRLAT